MLYSASTAAPVLQAHIAQQAKQFLNNTLIPTRARHYPAIPPAQIGFGAW